MAKIVIPNSRFASRDDSQTKSSNSGSFSNENDIAVLAYYLWQSRGCPDGSAAADWYQAEEEMKSTKSAGSSVWSASA